MATPTNGVSMPHLLAAFDRLGAHVCLLDAVGTVRWVNEPWRRFVAENGPLHDRCSEGSDYLGACSRLRTPDQAESLTGLQQVIAGELAEVSCDYPIHSPSAQRWFHLVARSVRGEDGERGTIVVHTDITARVLAEQERAAVARNLVHLQRMESLGISARAIAHEFNNVLTTLIGNLELAKLSTPAASPIRELLQEMAAALDRSCTLVARLRELTQARSPHPESVVLRALVDEVAATMRTSLPSTQQIRCSGDETVAVRADRTQLRQLLLNLCGNAADSLAGRTGTLTIRVGRERPPQPTDAPPLPDGDYACLTVHDDGRGLHAEDRARLFEPFHSPSYARQGSGLGLCVALAIAKGHGGTIDVDSEPGVGTRLRVFLPAATPRPTTASDR